MQSHIKPSTLDRKMFLQHQGGRWTDIFRGKVLMWNHEHPEAQIDERYYRSGEKLQNIYKSPTAPSGPKVDANEATRKRNRSELVPHQPMTEAPVPGPATPFCVFLAAGRRSSAAALTAQRPDRRELGPAVQVHGGGDGQRAAGHNADERSARGSLDARDGYGVVFVAWNFYLFLSPFSFTWFSLIYLFALHCFLYLFSYILRCIEVFL